MSSPSKQNKSEPSDKGSSTTGDNMKTRFFNISMDSPTHIVQKALNNNVSLLCEQAVAAKKETRASLNNQREVIEDISNQLSDLGIMATRY